MLVLRSTGCPTKHHQGKPCCPGPNHNLLNTARVKAPSAPGSSHQLAPPHRQMAAPASAAASNGVTGDSSSSQGSSSSSRHAVLHDFCMTIPYSGIAVLAGIILLCVGAMDLGMQTLAAGVAVGVSSILSLKSWKNGAGSALFTTVSAASSGAVAYAAWQQAQKQIGVTYGAYVTLVACSAAAALFCTYNLLAGGNPPKKVEKLE